MSIIDRTPTAHHPITPVVFDLYRDIHKGIRTELFELTADAGRLDPADDCGVVALAAQVRSVATFLVQHAAHEDGAIQPVLEVELPALAATMAEAHEDLERRLTFVVGLADLACAAESPARRSRLHELYVELAAFTSAYLQHQDDEERLVMPAIEAAIGVDAVIGVHAAIIGAIPPPELAASLAVMLPAMNVDDRTELFAGMRAGAPAEAFAAMWSLAVSVLETEDHRAVASRLGL
jgi:hypothetical protein